MESPIIPAIIIFFLVNFLCTQVIYTKKYFITALIVSLAVPILFLLIFKEVNIKSTINSGCIILYYLIFLCFIKFFYKKVNMFFIKKKLIDVEYFDKDFTYVYSFSDIPEADTWDKKLASKPSWLDHLLTMGLIILPILFFWVINNI